MILFTLSYIYKEKNKHNRIYIVLYNRKSNKLYVHKMTYYKMCYKIFIIVIILYSKKRNKKKLNNRYYTNKLVLLWNL